MATAEARRAAPASQEEAAELVRRAGADGLTVRVRGGGTKLHWGNRIAPPDLELSTAALDRVLEHNEGDLTAVLEAGVPLEAAQERFAGAGQMLALDPPAGGATVGGVLATGDSGPLRHRYGAARDLVLGMTVALSDGSVSRSGGKVIKNVAGYDLAKLFTGSFGTLGLILQVAVRLHPLPKATATAVAPAGDPDLLGRAAAVLAHAPLEKECLDVRWEHGAGELLARFGGATALAQAEAARRLLEESGVEARVAEDDAALWRRQREAQRSAERAVVRVSGLQSELPRALRATTAAGGSLAGRVALGLWWIALPPAAIGELRSALAPLPCVVLDAPGDVEDVWGEEDRGAIALARRVKERFDPAGRFAPGLFAGGI